MILGSRSGFKGAPGNNMSFRRPLMELWWDRLAETLEIRTLDHASSREGVELGFYKFANETGGVKVDVPTPPRGSSIT